MDLLTILGEICSDVNYSFSDRLAFGFGDGYGADNGGGFGDGYGCGHGIGYYGGHGNGCNGTGWSNGDGLGEGYGFNDGGGITEINGRKVYVIDGMMTVVDTVFTNYLKAYTIGNDTIFTPCYVALYGSSFAHGNTLKEAFRDAMSKDMKRLPEDKRVKRFIIEHPDPDETLLNEELFILHHTLTGSCEFGRKEFCRKNSIDLESSMSISEFLTLTENEFGGDVIKKIREEYSRRD